MKTLAAGALMVVLLAPASARAQALTQAEQLRAAIVGVLSGPLCLAKNHTDFQEGKWSVIPDSYGCVRALRDALAALGFTAEPTAGEPTATGAAAVVTCTYPLNVDAPPVCRAGVE